jgi:hypothetical protein
MLHATISGAFQKAHRDNSSNHCGAVPQRKVLRLRLDVMKTKKGVPPRVGYVLEAQALKEARR